MNAGEKKVFTFRLTLGCAIAIVGFCLYSQFKLWAQKPPAKAIGRLPSSNLEEGKPLVSYPSKGHAHGHGDKPLVSYPSKGYALGDSKA